MCDLKSQRHLNRKCDFNIISCVVFCLKSKMNFLILLKIDEIINLII